MDRPVLKIGLLRDDKCARIVYGTMLRNDIAFFAGEGNDKLYYVRRTGIYRTFRGEFFTRLYPTVSKDETNVVLD